MEKKEDPNFSSIEVDNTTKDEFQELLQTLEQQKNWDGSPLVKYQGFWFMKRTLPSILWAQRYFKARNSDIILATMPKAGTTWLKALVFSIVNRGVYTIDQSPLLTCNPHTLVPFLEVGDLSLANSYSENLPSSRILSTHMPFQSLPDSIGESECKIIYICRNPLDQFISYRRFSLENKIGNDAVPLELDEAFDMFCQGIHHFGPFWEQMLGYWDAHVKYPHKVLFLKYEDLKEDITFNVKKIAEFLGCPFSLEEENEGLIEEISKLCSFENLRNLEVNKTGHGYFNAGCVKNSSYFRKGEVGDWTNYLTPAMAERMKKIMRTKFEGSGLVFKTQNKASC